MQEFDLGPVIEGYLVYLRDVRRLASGSLRDIRCTFKNVLIAKNTIRPERELWELSLDDFIKWIDRSRSRGASVLSISKQISHLRTFIDYAWRTGRTDRNVLDGFTLKDADTKTKIHPTVLTVEQARTLINACDRKTPRAKRERIMILLLYGCGLRSGELCRLDSQDVDTERQEIFIKQAKGDLQRRVPVPDGVWIELLAYLTEVGRKRGPLFKTEHKRRRIRQNDVLTAVHSAARAAGITQHVMPKHLRHSYATHLMDAGVDLGIIASLMGHRSPQETGVYLHALPGTKESAVDKLINNNDVKKEEK